MNRHAFRSVSRARPADLEQATQTLSSYFRQFSTSTYLAADESQSSPARRQSRAAAENIKSFATNNNARPQAEDASASQQPRVVDVKSLPRGGLRGRGGFRGRGGARGGASQRGGSQNRFAGARGGASAGGRGGRGGRGAARGRGRARRKDGEEDQGERRPTNRGMDEADIVEPSQQAFADAMRFGVKSTYAPSVTLESLAQYMPAVASGSAPKGPSIHHSLSTLGTADHVGVPGELPPSMYALDLKERGLRYFADVQSKERTEAHLQQKRLEEAQAKAGDGAPAEASNERIIGDAEEAVRKVVVDEAVAGQHQAPKYATDSVAIARNWHLRAETWRGKESKAFEDKLTSMLDKGKGGKKAKA